jgi:hypothetical protein
MFSGPLCNNTKNLKNETDVRKQTQSQRASPRHIDVTALKKYTMSIQQVGSVWINVYNRNIIIVISSCMDVFHAFILSPMLFMLAQNKTCDESGLRVSVEGSVLRMLYIASFVI